MAVVTGGAATASADPATGGGTEATVEKITPYHSTEVTYDLTIGQLHAYYVSAGDVLVLVHNCSGGDSPDATQAFCWRTVRKTLAMGMVSN